MSHMTLDVLVNSLLSGYSEDVALREAVVELDDRGLSFTAPMPD